ncbi:hypothetical protein JCM17380_23900 [Desulfosporosinus burensis]
MEIRNLADIRTGLVLSRKKAEVGCKVVRKYKVLTLKSFHPDGYVIKSDFDDYLADQDIPSEFITQEGDVVIRLSEPNTAVYIDATLAGYIIPSLFAILRIKSDQLNPRYLMWFLNSSYIKKHIRKSLIGSAIQVIQTSFLRGISIELLPMDKQERITELNQLFLKEKMLLSKLIDAKELLYEGAMNSIYEMNRIEQGEDLK